MDKNLTEFQKTERLWQRIAIIAGTFSFILCVMIIVNFLQINREDPVNTKIMDQLVERLHQDPSDNALREEIRALDLVARKAYFTSRWQVRTGGYLLLIGIAVVVIAMQVILANRKKEPRLTESLDEDLLNRQKITRRWISLGGTVVVLAALVMAFLSHQNLQEKFTAAAIPEAAVETVSPQDGDDYTGVGTENEQLNAEKDSIRSEQEADIEEPIAASEEENTPSVKEAETKADLPQGTVEVFANFRGPGGNGICSQKNIPLDWDGPSGRNILWKTKIPLAGFNSPIILGGHLFLTGAEESRREVYALDRNTGEIVWTTPITDVPGSPDQAPEVANYTGHAAPTMATDGKRVFAIFANGDMAALDLDGKIAWSKNLGVPVNHYGYSSSLLVHGDKVIIQYDQKNLARLIALNTATGEPVWTVKRNVKISWSSPILVNTGRRNELITVADPLVISYNPDNGEELWQHEGVTGEVGPSPAYADGLVFAINDYSRLVAIRAGNSPEILWEDEEYLSDIPSPVSTKGYLFVPTSYGMVVCYNAATGEKYWEQELENSIYASPLVVEGNVYLVDKQGVTQIFKADKEFVSLGTPALGEKVVCTPAFTDGRIYLRGYEHVYCIGR